MPFQSQTRHEKDINKNRNRENFPKKNKFTPDFLFRENAKQVEPLIDKNTAIKVEE